MYKFKMINRGCKECEEGKPNCCEPVNIDDHLEPNVPTESGIMEEKETRDDTQPEEGWH